MRTLILESIYKPITTYKDKVRLLAYSLLFLFPIAGMSVRHWFSAIFILLLLLALATLWKQATVLRKEERIFLWICAIYFFLYVLSATIHGWDKPQVRYLERDLRYLAIIPIYLMFRRYPDCLNWFLKGGIFAGFFLFSQALYDLFVLKLSFANGIYSKNIIGPFAVLIAFWLSFYLVDNYRRLSVVVRIVIVLSIIGAIYTCAVSGSRGAYLGFVITALFCIVFFLNTKWRVISICMLVFIASLFYLKSDVVNNRVDSGIANIKKYYAAENHSTDDSSITSVGVRLEMIRTVHLIVIDSPIIGIGPASYLEYAQSHIDKGDIHPVIANFANPHNAFLETLVSKGILGLLALLLLLYYPMYIFIRDYRQSKMTAIIGMLHIVAISSFSMTDHSVVVKNNYIAILLIGLAVFLSAHFNACKKKAE